MHESPDHDWTIVSLAKAAGMSRSAFAARFTDIVGRPAMTYLTDLRLRLAFERLRHGADPVATIAERSGYRSESSFTRAFRRAFGRSPTSVRREVSA